MKVSEIGEFGLINRLAKMIAETQDKPSASGQQVLIGIGDDTAAWKNQAGIQLATVDTFIQDVHFSLGETSWEDLGWKAMAANLSDIAAMGGVPTYALISLSLPESTEVADVIAFNKGMLALAQESGVTVVGGNISSAPLVAISITVLGNTIDIDQYPLTRAAAKPGEQIAITGYIGAAAAGLKLITKQIQADPETTAAYLKKAFTHPHPRLEEGQLLVQQGIKAAIDISDGLIQDLGHICEASQVGARLRTAHIPVDPTLKARLGEASLELVLAGGEDYELIFTGSADKIEKIRELAACPITVIGEIAAEDKGKVTLLDSNGKVFIPDKTGWDHFATRQG